VVGKMAIGSINSQIRSLIASKLQEKGIDLYEIEYKKEAEGQVIRIYIDTSEGVDVGICTKATKAIKDYLDTDIDLYYDYLEVSSPGIDRILKSDRDYERFQGERVLVKTSELVEGQKKFIGILANTNQDILTIEIEGNLLQISRDAITSVRLHPDI
jgi:ribosome maturation factor RimP